MGGFWSYFKGKLFSQPIKVFMGGLDSAGKTTILYTLKIGESQAKNMIPTIGFNVEEIVLNKNIRIQAWDAGGGCMIRKLFYHYYADCQALIWIVDCTDVKRIDKVAQQLDAAMFHEDLKKSIVLIMANKQDLTLSSKEFISNQQLIEKLDLGRLTEQKRVWNIMKCSGMTKQGLTQAMNWLGEALYKRKINKE